MVIRIHDTKCPYWEQVSLNNTTPSISWLFGCYNYTGHRNLLLYSCIFFEEFGAFLQFMWTTFQHFHSTKYPLLLGGQEIAWNESVETGSGKQSLERVSLVCVPSHLTIRSHKTTLKVDKGLMLIFGSSTAYDKSTTHPKFDTTGIQTHDFQIMSLRHLL